MHIDPLSPALKDTDHHYRRLKRLSSIPGILCSPKMQFQPRVTGNDIPDEVWRIIAGYVVRGIYNMRPYMSVNRSFYNFVLDERYGEVRLVRPDKRFLYLLKRLREPLVAQHVRSLHIRAWFVEYLLKRDALFKAPPTSKAKNLAMSSLESFISKLKPQPVFRKEPEPVRGPNKGPSSREIIQSLIVAVQGMTNVTKFSFEWTDLPINNDTRVFLTSPRTAFATSLRKLVLRARISKFKELLAITDFDNLDELDFHFDYTAVETTTKTERTKLKEFLEPTPGGASYSRSTSTAGPDPDNQELLHTIIPFINHRRSALRCLSISSSSSVNLSEFFKALPSDSIPHLRRFAAQISFSEQTLSDPSGILRLLKARAPVLSHVSLMHLPSWSEQIKVGQKDQVWKRVNDRLLSHSVYLSSLESLELPFVSIDKTIPLIQRSSETLIRLCLTNHFLMLPEVSAVLSVFSRRPFGLRHLRLEIVVLDMILIEMLATKLPGLLSLLLIFDQASPEFHKPDERASVVLSDWKLYELELYAKRYLPPSPEGRAMSGVAELAENYVSNRIINYVPSIRFVKGVKIR